MCMTSCGVSGEEGLTCMIPCGDGKRGHTVEFDSAGGTDHAAA
jgi:hypothetical protein